MIIVLIRSNLSVTSARASLRRASASVNRVDTLSSAVWTAGAASATRWALSRIAVPARFASRIAVIRSSTARMASSTLDSASIGACGTVTPGRKRVIVCTRSSADTSWLCASAYAARIGV